MVADLWRVEIDTVLKKTPEGWDWKVTGLTRKNPRGSSVLDQGEAPGGIVISYNAKILESLMRKGKISKDIGEPLLEDLNDLEKHRIEFSAFLKDNPNASEQDMCRAFERICINDPEKISRKRCSLFELIALKHVIEEEANALKTKPLFKNHLRLGEDFGITKTVADHLFYLPELLQGAQLIEVDSNSGHYLISSDVSSSKRPVRLEYYFIAPDKGCAEQMLALYKQQMDKEGLKVLLGFWSVANDHGKFDYTADITEIMGKIAALERESYFSVKEKKMFWGISRLLENTKLILMLSYKRGRSEKILNIEHRLIDVLARDSNSHEEQNGYPNTIRVRVLDPEKFEEKAQLATAIANGIPRLPPRDIMLGLTTETRAAQTRDKSEDNQFDEEFLMSRGNLQSTKQANPRVARQRLGEKLNRIRESGAIAGWEKGNGVYRIKKSRLSIYEEDE